MKVALQMYNVRDAIHDPQSLFAALEEVKKIGYEGVEFAGCFGASPEALGAKLRELGLTPLSCHEGLGRIDEIGPEEMVDFYHAVGVQNFVCAGAPTGSLEELAHLRAQMLRLQERAKKYGMGVGYHNHAHEFRTVEGIRPIDDIASYCPLELDTYWSFIAGEDNGAFIRQNRERIMLLHLKDGSAGGKPCAIGEGVADIAGVLEAARETGFAWVIVENDDPTPDGFSDVRRSLENLRARYCL